MTYAWWTVWTAVSGEGVKMQISSQGTSDTVGVDQATLAAIKLSDDLTESTDWYSQETSANTTLGNGDSSTNNASVSFTPPASTDWVVMSKSRIDPTDITVPLGSRIVSTGTTSSSNPFCQIEGEDATNDFHINVLVRVYNSLAASTQTFTEKSFSTAASAATRTMSGIFALNLNKLSVHASSYDDSSVQALSTTAYGTNVRTTSITPTVQGDVWCWAFMTFDSNSAGNTFKARLQVDDTDQPGTQTSDSYTQMQSWDVTDELDFNIQTVENLTTSSHTIDLDASESATTGTPGARCKCVFAVTMELGGLSLVKNVTTEQEDITEATNKIIGFNKNVTTESVGITEALNRLSNLTRNSATDTEGITEAVNEAMTLIRNASTENVGITEAINRLQALLRNVTTEQEDITETLNYIRGLSKNVPEVPFNELEIDYLPSDFNPDDFDTGPTDWVQIVEQALVVIGRVRLPSTEQVDITEALNYVRGRIQVVNETLDITEAINRTLALVRNVNESIDITENINRIANLVRNVATEDIGITESTNIARALVRLVNEQIDISEALNQSRGLTRVVDTETVSILEDAQQRYMQLTRVINETINLTEAINTALGKIRVINEQVDLTEALNYVLSQPENELVKIVNEDVGITEQTNLIKAIIKVINDGQLDITEAENHVQSLVRNVIETVQIDEALNKIQSLVRNINEQVDINEAAPYVKALTRVVNETIALSENIVSAIGKVKVVTEAIDIAEDIIQKVEEFVAPIEEPSRGGGYYPRRHRLKTTRRQRYITQLYAKPVFKVEHNLLEELKSKPRHITKTLTSTYYHLPLPTPLLTAELEYKESQYNQSKDKPINKPIDPLTNLEVTPNVTKRVMPTRPLKEVVKQPIPSTSVNVDIPKEPKPLRTIQPEKRQVRTSNQLKDSSIPFTTDQAIIKSTKNLTANYEHDEPTQVIQHINKTLTSSYNIKDDKKLKELKALYQQLEEIELIASLR